MAHPINPTFKQKANAVKARLYAEGTTLKQWAEDNGYSPTQVYRVMRGENKALYGEGHAIAVKLGLKSSSGE
ncbi:MAG: DNA-binding protein [Moraxella sp.]|nr:DNA-binding protein [Moraxella sp.]